MLVTVALLPQFGMLLMLTSVVAMGTRALLIPLKHVCSHACAFDAEVNAYTEVNI